MNTTLETEVQTISRQLERRSELSSWLTRVKGWRHGVNRSWSMKASLGTGKLRCCEEFSTHGQLGRLTQDMVARWWMDSLNRWEKTIGLCRTASGVDISDGILAATVLQQTPESYQNILKQNPSNVRASYSAMRGWSPENAATLRRYDVTSGSSSHQTPST